MRRVALVLALFSSAIALAASPASPTSDMSGWNSVSWSPDGEWIAATGMPDYGFSAVAFRVDAGESAGLATYLYRGKWSPDGRRVALVSGGDLVVRTVA